MKQVFFFLFSSFFSYQIITAQAVEPAAQPTAMQFASVKQWGFVMSFTTTTADGYLVLKSAHTFTDTPADGTTYEKGQGLSGCKVMYVGANNIFSVREVLENTTYYFRVFAYNGTGANINYLQTNPLTGSVTTPVADAGTYYAAIDSSAGTFIGDLHNLINTHTQISYTPGYSNTIVPVMYERDTVGGQEVVNCEYSNYTYVYSPPFSFLSTVRFSREHVLCKSWMQTYAQFGAGVTDYPEGSDQHNLLLTELDHANTPRSNHPEGIVLNPTNTFLECRLGTDNTGNTVFEPRDACKGDAARAMMYEMVCYDGLSGGWGLNELLSEAYKQDQNILKLWNQQDPPDKFERTKNEYVFSIQHNRNPFIDHPAWATCINFDSLIKTNFCGALSGIEDEILNVGTNIYPNPAKEILNVEILSSEFSNTKISVYDVYAREVLKSQIRNQKSELNIGTLEAGNYLLKISADGKSAFRKFLIIR